MENHGPPPRKGSEQLVDPRLKAKIAPLHVPPNAIHPNHCSEILGCSMGSPMTTELVREALATAIRFRKPLSGCIHHSDRGSQYCSGDYRNDIAKAGLLSSMSRTGNCFDNAPTESFWGCLKQELVYHRRFKTRDEAKTAIREYIEIFYNRVHRHSKIGYVAPSIYAESFYFQKRSA
ncbi:MAG: integrase core domain-containing protein [Rectinemataceae bacterium]|nr:integrase core domain-containing protein [Rectinemataceae bacterium]